MPTDVRDLLHDAAATPSRPPDVGALVTRGCARRRRRGIALGTVVLVIVVAAGLGTWSATRPSSDRIRTIQQPPAQTHDFGVRIPPGWHRADHPLSALTDPHEILAVATFPLDMPTTNDAACDNQLPTAVVDAMRPDDAFVWVLERRQPDLSVPPLPGTGNGPSVLRPFDCAATKQKRETVSWGTFQNAGRQFYAAIVAGPSVSSARRTEAESILESLAFTPRHQSANVDATLAWITPGGGVVIGDPSTGNVRSFGPTLHGVQTSPFVRIGGDAFTAQNGTIYHLLPSSTRLEALGPGDVVFPSPFGGAVYVGASTRPTPAPTRDLVSLVRFDGTPSTISAWHLPAGYVLTDPPRAVNGGVLIETPNNALRHTFAIWDPTTGSMRVLGTGWQPVDTTLPAGGAHSVIARVDVCGTEFCQLLLTGATTGQTRTMSSPVPATRFIGGGAFSPDGSRLAAFVSASQGGGTAQLVIVDVATGRARVVPESDVTVGEPYGYATWSPSGAWVVFGASGAMHAYEMGAPHAVSLPFTSNYSVVALPPG